MGVCECDCGERGHCLFLFFFFFFFFCQLPPAAAAGAGVVFGSALDIAQIPPPPILPSQVLKSVAHSEKNVVLIQAFVRRKLVFKKMAKYRARCQVIKELALTENK